MYREWSVGEREMGQARQSTGQERRPGQRHKGRPLPAPACSRDLGESHCPVLKP